MADTPQGEFSGTVSDFNPAQLLDQERFNMATGEIERAPSHAIRTDPASTDLLRLEVGPFASRATELRNGEIQGVLPEYIAADRDADYPEQGRQQGFFGSSSGRTLGDRS